MPLCSQRNVFCLVHPALYHGLLGILNNIGQLHPVCLIANGVKEFFTGCVLAFILKSVQEMWEPWATSFVLNIKKALCQCSIAPESCVRYIGMCAANGIMQCTHVHV